MTWGVYRPIDRKWVPSDAEWKEDPGVGLRWWATDFEVKGDVGYAMPRDESFGTQTFPLSSYIYADVDNTAGAILGLFSALNVLTGVVIGQCLPRHRNGEFLKFLRTIDRQVPKGLQIHMILDTKLSQACWPSCHPKLVPVAHRADRLELS